MRVLCRYTMKHLAEAYKRYFAGAGFPDGKRKYKDTPQFTVPQDIKIKGQKIYIPKIGWARLTGQNPYADCQPKQAMFKYEARDGYVSILYAVPDPRPARPVNPMHPVGIDRNVGQVALSTEVMYALPGLAKRDAKLHRRQRKLARQQYKSNGWQRTKLRMPKVQRKIVNVIKDWCHQTRRTIADIHDVVILAALNMQGMTRSARGSKENPGQHVAQKRGLNRAILRSGWGRLKRYMDYKTYTAKIDPKYTSQCCHTCGVIRKANRKSQSVYHGSACGGAKNADVNAALNIRDKWLVENTAFGDGASADGGGSVSWPVDALEPAGRLVDPLTIPGARTEPGSTLSPHPPSPWLAGLHHAQTAASPSQR